MLHRFNLRILLGGLTLLLFGPACKASSLGLAVYAVPLDSNGGKTAWAHFTAIAPSPCPALSDLCAAGEDCQVYPTSLPFTGMNPKPGWCVRQWQKIVPSNYNSFITLGSTEMYVSMNAGPTIRENTGKLNQPPYVALPPPLRARVNCPHDFSLSIKDLDGDRVQCRYARPEQGECLNCTRYSFIELDEEKCTLTFTGAAQTGQYFIYLMAEDFIPSPRVRLLTGQTPLSSIPVQLSLTVEASTTSCNDEPMVNDGTPKDGSTLFVLPYQQVNFNVYFMSQLESVSEIAVVGPPELYRTGFLSVGPLATMTMAWIRSENNLTHLLPICFVANTISLQSEPRCVWLYQREMKTLPSGTELKCEKTEMVLVLPVTSLSNINLAELQLNSPTCPITYNSTHLTAHISLSGCGTKTVQAGSELVYTNTLQSVRPYTMVSRKPSLILPLACRIPGIQVRGPQFNITMPTEKETFGVFDFQLEFYLPGEGPMSKYTRTPTFQSLQPLVGRRRREAETPSGSHSISIRSTDNTTSGSTGSRISQLDLYVLSNCTVNRAELIVSQCVQSETEDFAQSTPVLQQGCLASNGTLEILTPQTNVKIYRLDLSSLAPTGSTMFVQCTVNLCITTMPSQTCPNLCTRAVSQNSLVNSVFTRSYTVTSGRVSLVLTTPAPSTTTPVTTISTTSTTTLPPPNASVTSTTTTTASSITTTTTAASSTAATTTATNTKTTTVQKTTTSYAPKRASGMAAGVILTTIGIFFQNIFLY